MLTRMNVHPKTQQHRARNRFLFLFFVAGAVVPLALMTYGWLASTTQDGANPSQPTGTAQSFFAWLAWPTWILMIDAEHAGTFAVMLLLTVAANGLWYAAVGAALWYVGEGLKRLGKAVIGHS